MQLPPRGGGDGWNAVERLAERVGVRVERIGPGTDRERRDDGARRTNAPSEAGAVAERWRLYESASRFRWTACFATRPNGAYGWHWTACKTRATWARSFAPRRFSVCAAVVTMRDRAAPLSSVVYDVASGGLEAVPFALETNLRSVLDSAKAAGVWIVGSAEQAEIRLSGMCRATGPGCWCWGERTRGYDG